MPKAVWHPASAPTSAIAVASRVASRTKLTTTSKGKGACTTVQIPRAVLVYFFSTLNKGESHEPEGRRFLPVPVPARAQHYSTGSSLRAVLQAASRATKQLDQPQPLVMNTRGAPSLALRATKVSQSIRTPDAGTDRSAPAELACGAAP